MNLTPGLGRSPEGENGNPLQYFFPGKSHGQRSLAGYSPWGHKESDIIEHTGMIHMIKMKLNIIPLISHLREFK